MSVHLSVCHSVHCCLTVVLDRARIYGGLTSTFEITRKRRKTAREVFLVCYIRKKLCRLKIANLSFAVSPAAMVTINLFKLMRCWRLSTSAIFRFDSWVIAALAQQQGRLLSVANIYLVILTTLYKRGLTDSMTAAQSV